MFSLVRTLTVTTIFLNLPILLLHNLSVKLMATGRSSMTIRQLRHSDVTCLLSTQLYDYFLGRA